MMEGDSEVELDRVCHGPEPREDVLTQKSDMT